MAYLEFLKANGIEDPGLLREMDYQDVLNQQEIYGEELNLFANKDYHKEVCAIILSSCILHLVNSAFEKYLSVYPLPAPAVLNYDMITTLHRETNISFVLLELSQSW